MCVYNAVLLKAMRPPLLTQLGLPLPQANG